MHDTICGVATPIGEGGIGIIRISGPDALSIAEQIVRVRSGRSLASSPPHTLHLADVVCASADGKGEVVDEGFVVFMRKPRSFTAEDVVEIHCHGGGMVLGLVSEACLRAGARLADPGEFTKRAFLNGRLDLSQAEAVLDTIRAKSESGLRMAQRHLRGELGREVTELRWRLLCLLGELEAGIDFTEEDIQFVNFDEVAQGLASTIESIRKMLGTAKRGIRLREGARVVITGRPNVGKSSLLNSLLGVDRAIVTSVPGTTRDLIEESVVWDGVNVTLVDTAGLRDTDDVVEGEGIKRAQAAVQEADLVVEVVDVLEVDDGCVFQTSVVRGEQVHMLVLNKIDLVDEASLARLVQMAGSRGLQNVIGTSVRNGAGVEKLRQMIGASLSGLSLEPHGGAVVTNIRHCHALERAGVSLERALDAVRQRAEPEFVVVDVRESADALGEVTGAITSEEILNHIFSQFCIGK